MSAHDLVVSQVRCAVDRVTKHPDWLSAKLRLESFGSDRRGEQHYVITRGKEIVRVTVVQVSE